MKKIITALFAIISFHYSNALNIKTEKIQDNIVCGGETINVSFVVDAPANIGNVFTAQLSDKNGNFSSPKNIGSLPGISSGTIAATIQKGTETGAHYKIRVVASNPATIGAACPNNVGINPPPTNLNVSNITACEVTVGWTASPSASSYRVRYKVFDEVYSEGFDVGNVLSYTFTGLSASTKYAFQVRAVCAGSDKSSWKTVYGVTTDCGMPTGLVVTAIGTTTTSLNWNDVPCATQYVLNYRMFGSSTWTSVTTTTSNADLDDLFPATLYEAQVAADCGGTLSTFTASTIWETEYFRLSGHDEVNAAYHIFPNPTDGDFNLQFVSTSERAVTISVKNIYGQVVYATEEIATIGVNTSEISLSDLSPGMYYVSLSLNDKEFIKPVLVN